MGILSIPHETLDPEIWDLETLKLKKYVELAVLRRVSSLIPNSTMHNLIMIGSTIGYKWSDDSDVDVNLQIDKKLITTKLQAKRKNSNGKLIPDTVHPLNIFITPITSMATWDDSYYGAYDVIHEKWLKLPPLRSTIRDPNKEFYNEIRWSNMELNYFKSLVHQWKKYVRKGQSVIAAYYFKLAKEMADKLDNDRKIDYEYHWGVPRKNWENVIYKRFEHSDVGETFENLKELKN